MENSIVMNWDARKFMDSHFDETAPKDFYRAVFRDGLSAGEGSEKYAIHGHILSRFPKIRQAKVWDDLSAIDEWQGKDKQADINLCGYIGDRRLDKNVRRVFGLSMDIDHLQPLGTENLFKQFDVGYLPRPTFVAWSGRGLHAYYLFKEPMDAFAGERRALSIYNAALQEKMLNRYVTERWGRYGDFNAQELEAVFQTKRMVGSGIRNGEDVCRVYRTGDYVDLSYLNRPGFLEKKYRINPSGLRKEEAIKAYPKWGAQVMAGEDPHYWKLSPDVYEWWKEKLRSGAHCGGRYWALWALAVYGIKCSIPYEQVRRDAYGFMEFLNSLTVEGYEEFTEEDVKAALQGYHPRYRTVSIRAIEAKTGIPIPRNKRNGNTMAEHQEQRRFRKEQLRRAGKLKKEGRPDRAADVAYWRLEHPEGGKLQCGRDIGADPHTVRKHWDAAPQPKDEGEEFRTLDDIAKYMENTSEWEAATILEQDFVKDFLRGIDDAQGNESDRTGKDNH